MVEFVLGNGHMPMSFPLNLPTIACSVQEVILVASMRQVNQRHHNGRKILRRTLLLRKKVRKVRVMMVLKRKLIL